MVVAENFHNHEMENDSLNKNTQNENEVAEEQIIEEWNTNLAINIYQELVSKEVEKEE